MVKKRHFTDDSLGVDLMKTFCNLIYWAL